jgi:hypothetical protein
MENGGLASCIASNSEQTEGHHLAAGVKWDNRARLAPWREGGGRHRVPAAGFRRDVFDAADTASVTLLACAACGRQRLLVRTSANHSLVTVVASKCAQA